MHLVGFHYKHMSKCPISSVVHCII